MNERPEANSHDPRQTNVKIPRKVVKGGSHLCAPNYCRRYRPAARHAQQVDSPTPIAARSSSWGLLGGIGRRADLRTSSGPAFRADHTVIDIGRHDCRSKTLLSAVVRRRNGKGIYCANSPRT